MVSLTAGKDRLLKNTEMKKPECFDDYNNADSMRVLTDDEISACEEYAKHTMKPFVLNTTRSIQFNKEYVISELIKILSGIIKDPYGCPMCDSGKLRDPEKQHWPECLFYQAENLINLLTHLKTKA